MNAEEYLSSSQSAEDYLSDAGLKDAPAQQQGDNLDSQMGMEAAANTMRFPAGIGDATAKSLPLAGAIAGGELGLPFGPLGAVGGAAIGAMGGQGFKSVYDSLSGANQSVGDVAQGIRQAGQGAGLAQMGGMAAAPIISGAAQMAGNAFGGMATRFGKQLAGIPETVGNYVLGRGPSRVLTHENMIPGAADNALESAQSFLQGMKFSAIKGVASAEDSVIASGQGERMFDTSAMANSLRTSMARHGFTGKTAGLAGGKDISLLNEAQSLLDAGKLSGSDLIKVKRLLADAVDYSGGKLPEIGSIAEGMLKGVAADARQLTNSAYPGLGEANSEAHNAFGLYGRYRPLLTESDKVPEVLASNAALRKVRGVFTKEPAIAEQMSKDLGPGVSRPLFDTVAAQHYTANSPVLISPSSPFLKGLSILGLTGPQVAGAALRAAGAAQGATGAIAGASVMSPALAQAAQHMSQQSLAAFYRSPGE